MQVTCSSLYTSQQETAVIGTSTRTDRYYACIRILLVTIMCARLVESMADLTRLMNGMADVADSLSQLPQ
eukprot:scaffold634723_cov22-Prasinocladus_malaysianus.AAC.1